MMKKLSKQFFQRPATRVAPDLLGCILRFHHKKNIVSGYIVETEAYLENEPASHSFGGMRVRNQPMFLLGGHTYVYFIYGNHFCFNIVTGKKDSGEAVLIRAIEPIEGVEMMKKNRKKEKILDLCSGPGKLCQAFGINKSHNAVYLPHATQIMITKGMKLLKRNIEISKRIGIRKAADLMYRYTIRDSKFVSR